MTTQPTQTDLGSGGGSSPGVPGVPGALPPRMEAPAADEVVNRFRPLSLADDVARMEEERQALQVAVEEQEMRRLLAERAAALGMHVSAFETLLARDPQLAADVLAAQAREELRRGRVGEAPDEAAVDAERLERSLRDLARGAAAGEFDPQEVAARARAQVPVHGKQVWTMMFPPPGYGGRDPNYVHEAKLVPRDRVGEYARLGFTLVPQAPLWTSKPLPVVCGIRTNLGTVCQKRFETTADRYQHWRAKHPAELEALLRAAQEEERRREEERWQLEREERRLALEYQRRQLELLARSLDPTSTATGTGTGTSTGTGAGVASSSSSAPVGTAVDGGDTGAAGAVAESGSGLAPKAPEAPEAAGTSAVGGRAAREGEGSGPGPEPSDVAGDPELDAYLERTLAELRARRGGGRDRTRQGDGPPAR